MTIEEFVKTRKGFAIVGGKLIFQVEPKETLPWMQEDLGLSEEEIEETIRGGIFKDRISICVGSNYDTCDLSKVSAANLLLLIQEHASLYPNQTMYICNGQVKGGIGVDWEQRENLGCYLYLGHE